jgi:hypothetical protein
MVSNQLGSLIVNLESLKTGMDDSVKGLQQVNANLRGSGCTGRQGQQAG